MSNRLPCDKKGIDFTTQQNLCADFVAFDPNVDSHKRLQIILLRNQQSGTFILNPIFVFRPPPQPQGEKD